MASTTVYLGLGANVGDRSANIHAALERLERCPGIRVLRVSSLRETAPSGGPPQGPYLNGVAELSTTLPAPALLAVCKALETAAGRRLDAPRNAPRPLDLDVLLYGDEEIDTAALTVPHPRLWERQFVLDPLAELGVTPPAQPRRPLVCATSAEFAALSRRWLRGGCRTGLVPTMGALHEGHASLLRRARGECDRVAATIFVNPLQFGAGEDLARYPRTLEADLQLLAREEVDAVYVPAADAVYPPGFCTHLSVGEEARELEGAARAGHFAGVVTVVAKLLAAARPERAYFGAKDAQQVAVLRRMVADLDFDTEVVECPTVRAGDGLALSSRNAYLSAEDRRAATALSRALRAAAAAFDRGERAAAALLAAARTVLAAEPGVAVEYLELRQWRDLAPLSPGPIAVGRLLVAARVGGTRLIDNLVIGDRAAATGGETHGQTSGARGDLGFNRPCYRENTSNE